MVKDMNNQPRKEESDALNILSLIDKILHAWPWFLLSIIICMGGAFVVNRYSQPLYRANTSVLVTEPKDVNNAVSEILYGQEFFGGSANLENEAYLLKSYGLVQKTLQDLNFNVSYFIPEKIRDVEIYKSSPIQVSVLETSSDVPYGELIKCTVQDDSTYKLEILDTNLFNRLTSKDQDEFAAQFRNKSFEFGKIIELKGFHFIVDYVPNNYVFSKEILFKIDDYQALTYRYLENLKVDPLSLESSVLEISIVDTHPEKASDYINKLVDSYITEELDRKNVTAQRTINFINTQILLMSDSLSSVETQMETFKKSNTQLTISTEGNNYLEKSQQYQEARSQLILNNRYLAELENYINQDNLDEIVVPSSIGIADPALNKSIQDLVTLQLQIQAISSTKNPVLKSYQQRIDILKTSIIENIRSLRTSNNLALNNINQQVGGIRTTLENLPTAEREFVNIQRKYNLSENLYLFLMEKKAEAGIAQASNTIDIRIVDEARPLFRPIKPKPSFNFALSIIVGFAIPFGILLLADLLNNKVRSKDDLLRLTSIPYLGLIAKNKSNYPFINKGMIRPEVSETFRTIRSNLRYMLGNTNLEAKVFLLTSSVSSEGKSFCSSNLAIVFSNFGKKVLLIDADMRKEKDYSNLNVEDSIGLSDYLAGLVPKNQIIKETTVPNLKIVTAGGIPPNPSELLISGKFEELLNQLKPNFDYIIIDTPPIGILSDGLELMEMCDVNIYVVRENYTLKRHILDLNNVYQQRNLQKLAILLNAVNYSRSEYGYYGKYYNQYYSKKTMKATKNQEVLTNL